MGRLDEVDNIHEISDADHGNANVYDVRLTLLLVTKCYGK